MWFRRVQCLILLVVLVPLLFILLMVLDYSEAAATEELSQLKVGRSIDIFPRFGYLSISMKVVEPYNDTSWIFREPTVDVFSNIDQYTIYQSSTNTNSATSTTRKQRKVFDGDFHMEFCDNMRQLIQAYFRDFKFELVDQPWKAFTSSWSTETLARNLGINPLFTNLDYCYVLVRLSRTRERVRIRKTAPSSRFQVVEDVEEEINHLEIGNAVGVLAFIKKFGSHYIQSYVTGNSLYQVFVYRKKIYQQIKEALKNQGIANIRDSELTTYFSPVLTEHIGHIKVASGNKTVQTWAATTFQQYHQFFNYKSLLKSKGNTKILLKLNSLLGNEAVLGLEMKSLGVAFSDPDKRMWFEEVLDNFLNLWDSNL